MIAAAMVESVGNELLPAAPSSLAQPDPSKGEGDGFGIKGTPMGMDAM